MKYILMALLLISFNVNGSNIVEPSYQYNEAKEGYGRLIIDSKISVLIGDRCSFKILVNDNIVAYMNRNESVALSLQNGDNKLSIGWVGGFPCPNRIDSVNINLNNDTKTVSFKTRFAGRIKFIQD